MASRMAAAKGLLCTVRDGRLLGKHECLRGYQRQPESMQSYLERVWILQDLELWLELTTERYSNVVGFISNLDWLVH